MARTAKARAQRILLIVAFVLDEQELGGSVAVEDVVARFGISEKELSEDMELVFSRVGVSPFTPDAMVEAYVDDGEISIRLGDYFRRPVELTSEEALYLFTAGTALLDDPNLPPSSALASAVDKLASAFGISEAEVDVDVARADPDVLGMVADAIDRHQVLEIDYHSFGRASTGTRLVEPCALQAREGHWYLAAWCRTADDVRQFRMDRILAARPTESVFEPRDDVDLTDEFRAPQGRTVILDVPMTAGWVAETYPVESVETVEGRLHITLLVGTTAFLERLLLRLGTDVTVTDAGTGESLLSVQAAAARRLLTAYRA